MNRRQFLTLALGAASTMAFSDVLKTGSALAQGTAIKPLQLSDAEWQKRLTPAQYDVLRREGTERPFSSPLNEEKHSGVFACVGCGLELFPSKFKFDSGTGWPSFYDSIKGHIETKADNSLLMQRTEYHCAQCGGHHGHVFNDGPAPTGLRYCNNGVALTFIPAKS